MESTTEDNFSFTSYIPKENINHSHIGYLKEYLTTLSERIEDLSGHLWGTPEAIANQRLCNHLLREVADVVKFIKGFNLI